MFKELTRIRQYFEKIKNIENPPPKPEQKLDKQAAIRFIRADLADNSEVNTQLTEMIAKERAKAAIRANQLGDKRKAEAEASPAECSSEGVDDSKAEADAQPKKKKRKDRKGRKASKASK